MVFVICKAYQCKVVPNKKWIDSVSDAVNIPEIVDESESDSEVTGK